MSRAFDTAPWAPSWIGNVISPWLVAAWVAGAVQPRTGRGALAGLAVLGATVTGYLALAAADAGQLWPRLALLALLAGPAFGLAGAAWPRGGLWAGVGLLLLGVAISIESVLLWSGPSSALERAGIGLEGMLGIGLTLRGGWLATRSWNGGVDGGRYPSHVPAQTPAAQGEELCRFALELLDETDAIALRHVAGGLSVRAKADATLVTQVDTEVEACLRERIAERFPSHGVLGEEMGNERGDGETRWIIDPIDGTHNLVRGIPVWGSLLAVERSGELVAAAISAPALGRRWYAWQRGGAHVRDLLGERRIFVSTVDWLGEAQVVWSGLRPMDAAGHLEAMRSLSRTVWRDRGFGDFWGYMLVAEGAAEAMLEVGPNLWDLAAPALILAEAGGLLTDFAGQPSYAGPEALATNGQLHDAIVSVLAEG